MPQSLRTRSRLPTTFFSPSPMITSFTVEEPESYASDLAEPSSSTLTRRPFLKTHHAHQGSFSSISSVDSVDSVLSDADSSSLVRRNHVKRAQRSLKPQSGPRPLPPIPSPPISRSASTFSSLSKASKPMLSVDTSLTHRPISSRPSAYFPPVSPCAKTPAVPLPSGPPTAFTDEGFLDWDCVDSLLGCGEALRSQTEQREELFMLLAKQRQSQEASDIPEERDLF